MAKIALCGYGHAAQSLAKGGEEYAYVVNDNVNVGDVLQVIATSRKGRKFATTASPVETHKENSVDGQVLKQAIEESTGDNLTEVYSGKQLGIKGFKGNEAYQQQVRAQNLQAYMQNNPSAEMTDNASKLVEYYGNPKGVNPKSNYQTFDEYSKPFMKGDK